MKLLVIGHSVLDVIHSNNSEEIKPGGIWYTMNALNRIAGDDQFFLCSSMERELYHHYQSVYSSWNLQMLQWNEIPKVNLFITPGKERCEKYSNLNSSLSVDYSQLSSFDGILINMITGFDITLNILKEIRKHFTGPVYMDVHTLTRGVDSSMQRVFRQIEDFYQWKENLNIIQVNEHEILTLTNLKNEFSIAEEILLNTRTGLPEQLIITKGELGARVYYKKGNEIASYYRGAEKTEVVNTIGLGDTFGAVYFYSYLRTKLFNRSLDYAVKAGGFAASNDGFNQLKMFKNVFS